jgi:hypothetical protein
MSRECKAALTLKLLKRKIEMMQRCEVVCNNNAVGGGKDSPWKEKAKEYAATVKELKAADKKLRSGARDFPSLAVGFFDSAKRSAFSPDAVCTRRRRLDRERDRWHAT